MDICQRRVRVNYFGESGFAGELAILHIYAKSFFQCPTEKLTWRNMYSQMDPPKWTQIATLMNRPHSRLDPTHI